MADSKNGVNGTIPAVLPTGARRVMTLVERSRPDNNRPSLSAEFEVQLQEVHAKSAACYASMEDLGDQIERLAAEIADADGVVVDSLCEDDNSVVNHIEDVSTELRTSRTRLAATTEATEVTEGPQSPARERALTH